MAYPRVTFAPRVIQRNAACVDSCIGTMTVSTPRDRIKLSRSTSIRKKAEGNPSAFCFLPSDFRSQISIDELLQLALGHRADDAVDELSALEHHQRRNRRHPVL